VLTIEDLQPEFVVSHNSVECITMRGRPHGSAAWVSAHGNRSLTVAAQ